MAKGIFTISLDFELYWGVRDHRSLEKYGDNIRNVHIVVPRLLGLFEKYGIHCTWATVGFLFFNNKEELIAGLPEIFPDYLEKQYDPYSYLKQNELESVYHFAPELIKKIRGIPGQEIGTHTFSHFYTLEKNTTAEQFNIDLAAAVGIARRNNIEISSIVFPRNQYSEAHINVCREAGIKVYRGNENSGAYRPVSRENENLLRRAMRLVDAYINITGHHAHPIPDPAAIINIPASRFLRPYAKTLRAFEGMKLSRIKKSMEYAAYHGLIYQLWWHPHNFGRYTNENFMFLEKILKIYKRLNLEQKMESQTLSEIYSKIQNTHA
jgi:peptidoglycan/xylan/chitin deacetylase (PgdA/CDA1 family)